MKTITLIGAGGKMGCRLTDNFLKNFHGDVSAKQAIVVALMWGAESYYDLGVEISTAMYAPVSQVHRVTLEQMAMLEPALVETLAQTCMEQPAVARV